MIKVSHQYHHITAVANLKHRWSILMFKAACAYALGDNNSYTKLNQLVRSEFEQWRMNAEKQCQQKSHKNWLGAGETFMVTESDPTENGLRFRNIIQGRSRAEIFQTLAEMERNNWRTLYSII